MVVGRAVLTRLHRSEVVVKRWGVPIGNQYYRSVMPDFPISLCGTCNKVSDPHSTLMEAHHECDIVYIIYRYHMNTSYIEHSHLSSFFSADVLS